MIRRRYAVAVVGTLSGRLVELPFLRFWRRVSAVRWVVAHNQPADALDVVTYFAVVDRRHGPAMVPPMSLPPTAAERDATSRAFEALRADIRRHQGEG